MSSSRTDQAGAGRSLDRLAIHTITNKPWSLQQCAEAYRDAGIGGISVWTNAYKSIGVDEAARIIRGCGLQVPALVRGGFFVSADASARAARVDETRRLITDAATLGAEMLVLVVGASPDEPLQDARGQVHDGIAALIDDATTHNIRLAIEPLHPMYSDDRSCINTMHDANDLCDALNHPMVGIAVDVYHTWWDSQLEAQITRAGNANRLFAFHICDWRTPTRDLLNDRAIMGEGCINIQQIRGWMEAAGFEGFCEVEIFSDELWGLDQGEVLERVVGAWGACC